MNLIRRLRNIKSGFIKMKNLLIIFLCIFHTYVSAQPGRFVPLGDSGYGQITLAAGSFAKRIGNAVTIRIDEPLLNFSELLIAGCNGDWVMSGYRRVTHVQVRNRQDKIGRLQEAERGDSDLSQGAVAATPWDQSRRSEIEKIRPLLKTLCIEAAPEPLDVLVTLADQPPTAEQTGHIVSVLSGRTGKRNGALDLWIQLNEYRKDPISHLDGTSVLGVDGKPLFKRVIYEGHTLARMVMDCGKKTVKLYWVRQVAADGSAQDVTQKDPDNMNPQPVTKEGYTVDFLNAACRIYG